MSDKRVMYTYKRKSRISLLATWMKRGKLLNRIMVTCNDCGFETIFDVSAHSFTEWYDRRMSAADAFGFENDAAACIQHGRCSDCVTQALDNGEI